jgi:Zn-dependent peptidase ImmA (M78 family)/transcriptional regulator with XRE-family HTH domain
MRPGTPGFRGERLIQARESWGISATSLAELVGVSAQSISHYEQNTHSPGHEVMESLASQLKFPRAFFLRPVRVGDDAPIFWRSKSAALKSARRRARVRMLWLQEIVEFVSQFFNFPDVRLPDFGIPDFKKLTDQDVEKFSNACRIEWGMGNGPVVNVCTLLESKGVFVSRMRMDADGLDAFAHWPHGQNPFVVLGRDKENAPRSRFDAAHELAHLVLHRCVDQKRINTPADLKLLESQAHRFASGFMMPAQGFTQEVWAPTLDSLLNLKERWGCSLAAMIKACKYNGLVDDEQEKRLWINYNRRGWRSGEPLDSAVQTELPVLLRKSFDMLVHEGGQPKKQILLQLRLNSNTVEELAELPNGYFNVSNEVGDCSPRFKEPVSGERLSNDTKSNVVNLPTARIK